MRPRIEFVTLPSGRIEARIGVLAIGEITGAGSMPGSVYLFRLPMPSGEEVRFRLAGSEIEAKQQIARLAGEWFIAAGVMEEGQRLLCDETLDVRSAEDRKADREARMARYDIRRRRA